MRARRPPAPAPCCRARRGPSFMRGRARLAPWCPLPVSPPAWSPLPPPPFPHAAAPGRPPQGPRDARRQLARARGERRRRRGRRRRRRGAALLPFARRAPGRPPPGRHPRRLGQQQVGGRRRGRRCGRRRPRRLDGGAPRRRAGRRRRRGFRRWRGGRARCPLRHHRRRLQAVGGRGRAAARRGRRARRRAARLGRLGGRPRGRDAGGASELGLPPFLVGCWEGRGKGGGWEGVARARRVEQTLVPPLPRPHLARCRPTPPGRRAPCPATRPTPTA